MIMMFYSKKDLMELYDISYNTVKRTIAACGLDTSRVVYTEQEIVTRFKRARKLFREGYYSRDVRQFFEQKPIEELLPPPGSSHTSHDG
ncbi:conserved hypothetical protein [Hyella patelloides LEGE 07179]|uniref:Uncharacterized protein n=1 Tax=Hyella patelloides LEGE 07179 TaxID=945734 RepID=A0A563W553_9CYAN|nr:conserved hypothetical protein [Hyella patelloides LEGE 07179]